MNNTLRALIGVLSDGEIHSGQKLGAKLGISRAAVCKQFKGLGQYGLNIESLAGRGYRLSGAMALLDLAAIEAQLGQSSRSGLADLTLFDEIDSTNVELLRQLRHGHSGNRVCLAEYQNAGRGRRGRHWQTPFGSGVSFSVAWNFQQAMSRLGGLGLALGVAAAEVLEDSGLATIGLKWPNDLVVDDRKLGGILIEIRGEAEGPCTVVAGLGLNISLHTAGQSGIDQPWTDLQTLCGDSMPERNQLTGRLLDRWLRALVRFAEDGLEPFLAAWDRYDSLRSRTLQVEQSGGLVIGLGRGVDETGALVLETPEGELQISGGEVSVRVQGHQRGVHDPAH